jgi:glycosyltransferase involved in cell wall biosynthesis
MRLAVTTDWLTSFGGAERVLAEMRNTWGDIPIFTSVYDPRGVPDQVHEWDVRASWLQHLPFVERYSRALLPLMPGAFGRFDFQGYDAVVTCSSAFSKAIQINGRTRNICYCLTPPRYLWDLSDEYIGNRLRGMAARALLPSLRRADLAAAERVHHFIAISQTVAERIARIYKRPSTVIHPPVDVAAIQPNGRAPEDFYLVVSRLVGYKRVDLAMRAARVLGRKLLVVGDGPERSRLRELAGDGVQLLGRLSDQQTADLYARCRGFLFAGQEDFGIAPVEAQAAGRPVVAFGAGGATETVLDGVTGVHFHEQTAEAMAEAIERLERMSVSSAACRENAERFSAISFRTELGETVRALVDSAAS